MLKDTCLAAAETAPEPQGETSPADLPPLQGPRAKVKVEPCFIEFKAPLEQQFRGCFFISPETREEKPA